jgi:hypothetical protein
MSTNSSFEAKPTVGPPKGRPVGPPGGKPKAGAAAAYRKNFSGGVAPPSGKAPPGKNSGSAASAWRMQAGKSGRLVVDAVGVILLLLLTQ